jgi:Protein of unknown function (DUF2917)
MREIRTLEQRPGDAPACWFIDRPHTLTVCQGMLWLTVEGEADDRWLGPGDSAELSAHSKVWISSESGCRFALASAPAMPAARRFVARFAIFSGRRGYQVL